MDVARDLSLAEILGLQRIISHIAMIIMLTVKTVFIMFVLAIDVKSFVARHYSMLLQLEKA